MSAAAVARVAFFLALWLLPLTVYLGVYRTIPATTVGGGLENCGYVLMAQNPDADPVAVERCDAPRREARMRFAIVALGNAVLFVSAAGLAGRRIAVRGRRG